MPGGIDQAFATKLLVGCSPNTGTGTFPTVTGPINMRLITSTTLSTDTVNGSELATGGSPGYTAGGSAINFATPAAGSVTTTAQVSWPGMPAATLSGMEQWDRSGTPQRTFWGPWASGNISVAAGNTFTVASGNLTDSLA